MVQEGWRSGALIWVWATEFLKMDTVTLKMYAAGFERSLREEEGIQAAWWGPREFSVV